MTLSEKKKEIYAVAPETGCFDALLSAFLEKDGLGALRKKLQARGLDFAADDFMAKDSNGGSILHWRYKNAPDKSPIKHIDLIVQVLLEIGDPFTLDHWQEKFKYHDKQIPLIEIIAEDQLLSKVFKPQLWYNRQAEMKALWDLVPQKYHNQVDFAAVAKDVADNSWFAADHTTNLTKRADNGMFDPLFGRQDELEEMITTLLQRDRNNVMLLGLPGSGKTALVQGLAERIIKGDVPKPLRGLDILSVDATGLIAGTVNRGQFEANVKNLLDAIKKSRRKIILFIDEIHTGAKLGDGAGGATNLAQMLKPYIDCGEITVIGATTQAEYNKHIAPDAAFCRRFTIVDVRPPDAEQTKQILRRLKPIYATHHQVKIPEPIITQIVGMAAQYLPGRHEPDRSKSILDRCAAHAARAGCKTVAAAHVIDVVAKLAGVEPDFIKSRADILPTLFAQLTQRILGQDAAMQQVVQTICAAEAGFSRKPHQPYASFLFQGPSGVGKTETAKALARLLYGKPEALLSINMSTMQEKHNSALLGASPGYVGYGDTPLLQQAVERSPLRVILLDELEKAHPDVQDQLLPVLEEGQVNTHAGVTLDFRHAIVIATCNDPKKISVPLRGRFIQNLTFSPLSGPTINRLITQELTQIFEIVRDKHGIEVSPPTQKILDQIAARLDPQFGARDIQSVVRSQVGDPLAQYLTTSNKKAMSPGNKACIASIGEKSAITISEQRSKVACV